MAHDIQHVTDTAVWVAAYRAAESDRPDAVFRDPLAKTLAGERGAALAESAGASQAMAFALVVRTTAIDRLILEAIAEGADMVLNLGAGLDTRPYRLALPPSLRWVEVDFPATIDFKNAQLAAETPNCRLERLAVDLSNDGDRRALLSRLGAEARSILVITEGVVPYLSPAQAEALSRDLLATPAVSSWIQDYARGGYRRWGAKKLRRFLKNSPFRFDVADPLAFFLGHGWRVVRAVGILDEADRIGRRLPLASMFPWNVLIKLFPRAVRAAGNRTYGYVRFGRS